MIIHFLHSGERSLPLGYLFVFVRDCDQICVLKKKKTTKTTKKKTYTFESKISYLTTVKMYVYFVPNSAACFCFTCYIVFYCVFRPSCTEV